MTFFNSTEKSKPLANAFLMSVRYDVNVLSKETDTFYVTMFYIHVMFYICINAL